MPDTADVVAVKFICKAGRFVRESLIDEIKNAAFENDVEINVVEDKRFWDSTYRIRLTGKSSAVKRIADAIQRCAQELAERKVESAI